MRYLLDTVAMVRHFSGLGRVGKRASAILASAENNECHSLLVSVVSLMEVLYLAEKNRIPLDLAQALDTIEASPHYTIVDLSPEILKVAAAVSFPELHDRLIVAAAKWLGVGLISSDTALRALPDLEVIWD